jgi:hypothetical protein
MKMQQLELAFDLKPEPVAPRRRNTPRSLARWWFDRIHRTVADAVNRRREQAEQQQREQLARLTRERHARGLATRPPLALAR